MTMRTDITPLVLTYNEEANIGRTLARLTWAPRVVVVDSFSTDMTVAICRDHPNVEVVQRAFDDHTAQWNFGLQHVHSDWVLSLDADYVLSEALVAELSRWQPSSGVDGYFASFDYCVFGRPLRASLYPARIVLFRAGRATYAVDGHTQRLQLAGATAALGGHIQHDDRKPVDRWLADQVRYSHLEARHLLEARVGDLGRNDRLRQRIVWMPALVGVYALVARGLALDGWAGFYYVLQRVIAESLLSLRLLDERLRRGA